MHGFIKPLGALLKRPQVCISWPMAEPLDGIKEPGCSLPSPQFSLSISSDDIYTREQGTPNVYRVTSTCTDDTLCSHS